MTTESLFARLFIVEIFITIFGLLYINTDYKNFEIIYDIKDFVIRLFSNKNAFGILLSCILLIILLPCLIILTIQQLVLWLVSLGSFIWKLGMKEKKIEETEEQFK